MSLIVNHVIIARPDAYDVMADLLAKELSATRKANGCLHVSCATDRAKNEFRIWEIWEDEQSRTNYRNWREDRGDHRKVDALAEESFESDLLEYVKF